MVLLFGRGMGRGYKLCVGEGVWVVPDSEKATLSTVRSH